MISTSVAYIRAGYEEGRSDNSGKEKSGAITSKYG